MNSKELYREAFSYIEKEMPQRAAWNYLKIIEKAEAEAALLPAAYNDLAVLCYRSGDIERAVESIRRASDLPRRVEDLDENIRALCTEACDFLGVYNRRHDGLSASDSGAGRIKRPVIDNTARDLTNLISGDARTLLDIGCATGSLGFLLRRDGARTKLIGIERECHRAHKAEEFYDRVYVADIEQIDFLCPSGFFDCIVLNGVLEHLHDPLETVRRLRHYLSDDGRILARVRNVQHFAMIQKLLAGTWNESGDGEMNTGQIRFFTYNDLRQLFKEAGLIISEIRGHAPLPVSEKFRALIKAAMPLDLISESFEAETSSSYFTLCAKKAATASKERRVTTGYTSERMVPGKSHWRTELQHQVRYRYFAPLTRDKTILDAGCGVGYGTYILARQGALVHGVDRDGDSITHGIARYGRRNVTFQRSDLLEMRDTARYERICTFGVLEQAECDRTLLQALCRVLEDDGIIILSSSNGEGNSSIHNPQPANPFQKRAYRLGELIDTLRSFFPWVAMFGQNDGFIWPLPEGNLPLGEMAGHFIAVCGKQPFPCLYEKLAGAWDESCTSVVIAAGDGLERTRQCLAAIRRYTYDPYNIIVVDCGSADGTVEYLKGQPDVTLVPAGKDEGLWRSWLRGAARSMRGDIVVMRNTVVVSHDWLGKMRQTLDDDEKTGVVSPRANIRGGAQMSTILYDNMDEFIRYAGAVEEESFGRFRRIETPDDYCLLFRRAAFDEAASRLSEGSISTRRVCALVREWGYHIAEREDTFVHCMRH